MKFIWLFKFDCWKLEKLKETDSTVLWNKVKKMKIHVKKNVCFWVRLEHEEVVKKAMAERERRRV